MNNLHIINEIYHYKPSIHEILLNTLTELLMPSIENGKIYDVSYLNILDFDSFIINNENITYYKNGKEVQLSDKDVLTELYNK